MPAGEDSRVIVFSLGSTSSGIPIAWSAEEDRPGLYVIETQGNDPIRALARQIDKIKRPGDIVIVSIHRGGNWGYTIPAGNQKEFAHRLVDEARVDILHGHSSHHIKRSKSTKSASFSMAAVIFSMIMRASPVTKAFAAISG